MREYIFLDENNVVIAIESMDIHDTSKDFEYSAAISVENNVRPEIGQSYNGLTNTFS